MLRRLTISIVQTRGIKHTVNINWVRPDYVPSYKPQKSGDLEALPNIPESSYGKEYAQCEELKDAPESVKKLFSVAFLGRHKYNELVKDDIIGRIKRHKYDDETTEAKIASYTAQIRWLQHTMEQFPRNVRAKIATQEIIDKRKKLLKLMRQYDYKKFEWLLEKLNIEYKAHPATYNKLTRKESLRKLTEMHCEDVKYKKLESYRNLLESQQGPFLRQKLEALKFIKSEQAELKLEVTVTDQDIRKVEKQLEEWTARDEVKRQAKKKKKDMVLDMD